MFPRGYFSVYFTPGHFGSSGFAAIVRSIFRGSLFNAINFGRQTTPE
jgi:hypothetical protein